jgi:hypothetical protein
VPRSIPRRGAVLVLAALLAAGACSPSSAAAPAPDSGLLPQALALRSDTPYITGTVTRRDEAGRTLRLLVRAAADASPSAARTTEAVVAVHPDSLLVHRDGRAAPPRELVVGRAVTVWVRGPELRSMPPQVTASAILLEPRWRRSSAAVRG